MQGSQGTRQGPHDVKTIPDAMAHDVEHGKDAEAGIRRTQVDLPCEAVQIKR